ncbi:MAG: hypothetical protein HY290_22810 [Planctomycetia bacterium]|nr:hypothetical protein [Planctomycetia bacterium]
MPSLELLTRTELNPSPSAPAVAGVPAPAPAGAKARGPQFGNVLASTLDSSRSPAEPAAGSGSTARV